MASPSSSASSASSVSFSTSPSVYGESPLLTSQLSPDSHPFTSEEVCNQKDGQMAYMDLLERQKQTQEETQQWEQHAKATEERVSKEIVGVNALHESGHVRLMRRHVVPDHSPKQKLSRIARVCV